MLPIPEDAETWVAVEVNPSTYSSGTQGSFTAQADNRIE
jgi:hypothetical protein